MFTFDHHDKRFKYRVAGLCIHENYVLLTKTDHDDYWILPGGRVELLEDTSTALQREMFEETGHSAQIEDPAIPHDTLAHQTIDVDTSIELRWFELARLSKVHFQPAFLVHLMKDPPRTTQHVIAREHQERNAEGEGGRPEPC